MFTGIIEELGEVVEPPTVCDDHGRLILHGAAATEDLRPGGSIAVDGVCLTVLATGDNGTAGASADAGTVTVDVMTETLRRTTIGRRRHGDRINLERPMVAGGRLDGHIVQGHVDGTARLAERADEPGGSVLRFELDSALGRYVAPKGSIALDGVSLTVVEVLDRPDQTTSFTVGLIPTTVELTTLGDKRAEELVNVEVDVVAKYVERLSAARAVAEPADRDGARR